jgi:integrase/recombinase XerC
MARIKIEKLEYANGANQIKWLTKEELDRFIGYVQLEPNEFKRLCKCHDRLNAGCRTSGK